MRCCELSYFTVTTEIGWDHCVRYRNDFALHHDRWLIVHRRIQLDWIHHDSEFKKLPAPQQKNANSKRELR